MAKILINRVFCKGCGLCIAFCPMKVFEPSSTLSKRGVYPPEPVHIEKCNSCGICDLFCPDFAVIIEEKGES